jgi:uncharacterized protein
VNQRLKIADDLSLGLDSVTKTFAILAQRRKGKTYAASVIAEEMVTAGQPWVALDPTGAWWGLRSSADGKKAGLPVLVVGGAHGQLPLERTAGKLMADLVVDEPAWYVFDFSLFESKAAERQFATDFAERFYRRKGKVPGAIHLFVDEADMFVPQRTPSGDQRMLGAFEAIVRRGGIRGIGTTLISQRAAVVNKNVLEQIDVLVTLRTVGPNDQKAIKAYVDAFGTQEEQDALMASLAKLGLGEAWIWEPGGDLFERVQIRERRTFNSSATPKAGQQNAEPAKLADVDLDELRDKIAATVEKAKEEDPAELRKLLKEKDAEIKRLNWELDQRPDAEPVEVPVLANGAASDLRTAAEHVREAVAPVLAELQRIENFKAPSPNAGGSPRGRAAGAGRVEATARPAAQPAEDVELSKQAVKMLEVLVSRHPLRLTRNQWATASGYSLRSSSWSQSTGQLSRGGFVVEDHGEFAPTQAGFDVFGGAPPQPQSPEGIRTMWRGSLRGPQAVAFFDALVDAYPAALTRDELSELTGYSKSSSSFSATTSLLRKNKLVEETAEGLRASEVLFE